MGGSQAPRCGVGRKLHVVYAPQRNQIPEQALHRGVSMRITRPFAAGALLCLVACSGGGGGGTPPPVNPPTITTQPASQTVNAGSAATFTVAASGATSYQWDRNGQAIAGAISASYTLSPATSANNGDSYTVVVSNTGGSVTSSAAALRVTGISVLAGQIGGQGYADGPAAQARFWGPAALALDGAGNLYVADYNAVRKITPAGDVSTIVGSPRTCGDQAGVGAEALLCYPYALALDAGGNLYAADYAGNTVWRIDSSASMSAFSAAFGCIESLAVSGPLLYVGDDACSTGSIWTLNTSAPGAPVRLVSMPAGPIAGLSFDAAQNIYVANDTTIEQVAAGPTVSTLAGTAGVRGSADGQGPAAEFGCRPFYFGANFDGTTGATAIATLPSGTSYVADYCHNTIRKVTSSGAVTTFAGTAGVIGAKDGTGQGALFFQPTGLVLDPSGNLYVADYYNALIRKVTPAGVVTTVAGQTPHPGHADGAAADATFCVPSGVVADAAGNLYVADTYNYVIRKITPAGVVTTLAGIAGTPGFVNGPGQSATFSYPQSIAIDAAGNLYVTDLLNGAVRKVTPTGVVSTFVPPGQFVQIAGVAVDAAGNVYVTDHNGVWESGPSAGSALKIAALSGASGITVAPNGTLYITAGHPFTSGVGAVYSMTATHVPTLLAGTGLSNRLPAIVMGGDGNLYIGDVGNSVILKVTPSGGVTTVVGSPALPIETVPGGLPGKINAPSGLALLSSGASVSLAVVDTFEHAILRIDLP
jgi:sugar lactone lactonase YvrE